MSFVPPISVILVVFNGEDTISHCIESVLNQKYKEFELVIIDDGSVDATSIVCQRYQELDSRIRLFHKKNEGVSLARLYGLQKAIGGYIIYIDADDFANDDWLFQLYRESISTHADITFCDFSFNKGTYMDYSSQRPTNLLPSVLIEDMLNGRIIGALWNKLIKKSLFSKLDGPAFVREISLYEDLFLMIRLLLKGPRVAYVPLNLYNYQLCGNKKSITKLATTKYLDSQLTFVKHISTILVEHNYDVCVMNFKVFVKFSFVSNGISPWELFKRVLPEVKFINVLQSTLKPTHKLILLIAMTSSCRLGHSFFTIGRLLKMKLLKIF